MTPPAPVPHPSPLAQAHDQPAPRTGRHHQAGEVGSHPAWVAIRRQLELVSQSLAASPSSQASTQPHGLQSAQDHDHDHARRQRLRLLVAQHVSHAKAQIAQSGAIDSLVASLRGSTRHGAGDLDQQERGGGPAMRANAAETLLLFKELASSLRRPSLAKQAPSAPRIVRHEHRHATNPDPNPSPQQHAPVLQQHPAPSAAAAHPETLTLTTCPPLQSGHGQARPSWSTLVSVFVDVRELEVSLPGYLSVFLMGHGHASKCTLTLSTATPAHTRTLDLRLDIPFSSSTVKAPSTIDLACTYSAPSARSPTLIAALPVPKPTTGDLSHPARFSASAFTFTATHSTTAAHIPHPIHLPTLSHPYTSANLARWWRAHTRHLLDRLNTSPILAHPPLDQLLPTPLGSTTPVPLTHLLGRPIMWPTGSLLHAARAIQLLPVLHPTSAATAGTTIVPPHAALHLGCVTADMDRAVLLACVARGMRLQAAVLVGAGTLGPRVAVAVYDADQAGPSVYELPAPPMDQHWRPVSADRLGFAVALAVTSAGVYANESGKDGRVGDWRIARGDKWRWLCAADGMDPMEDVDAHGDVWVKSESPAGVEAVVESWAWANQVHMFPSRGREQLPVRVVEGKVKHAIQDWLAEQRGYLELDTTWDPELAHVLSVHLRSRASGVGFDLTRAMRRTIPTGWMFRGAPHTTVTCTLSGEGDRWAVEALVRRVVGEWARYAPAQAMVREADARARWAVGVVLEEAGETSGVMGCWVMVGVAVPEAEGGSASAMTTTYDEEDEEGTQTSGVVMGHAPMGQAV